MYFIIDSDPMVKAIFNNKDEAVTAFLNLVNEGSMFKCDDEHDYDVSQYKSCLQLLKAKKIARADDYVLQEM